MFTREESMHRPAARCSAMNETFAREEGTHSWRKGMHRPAVRLSATRCSPGRHETFTRKDRAWETAFATGVHESVQHRLTDVLGRPSARRGMGSTEGHRPLHKRPATICSPERIGAREVAFTKAAMRCCNLTLSISLSSRSSAISASWCFKASLSLSTSSFFPNCSLQVAFPCSSLFDFAWPGLKMFGKMAHRRLEISNHRN